MRNLRKVETEPVAAGDHVFGLTDPQGRSIAQFAWTPKQPGAEIVHSVIPFIAVALAGPWHEFEPPQGDLPPIADISAPPAVPAAVRARLNGGFLGIDDLYVRAETVPRGYIDEADRVVAAKTREYLLWLEGRRMASSSK